MLHIAVNPPEGIFNKGEKGKFVIVIHAKTNYIPIIPEPASMFEASAK